MRYASFGRRFAAYLIDGLIVGLIAGIPSGCLGGLAATMAPQDEETLFVVIMGVALIGVLWGFIAVTLYYAMMWSRTGQTLGKKWLGIKVVTADGLPPSFWRAVGRALIGYMISSWIFSLGFLWMLWDDYCQGWHDKLFGTYVVEA